MPATLQEYLDADDEWLKKDENAPPETSIVTQRGQKMAVFKEMDDDLSRLTARDQKALKACFGNPANKHSTPWHVRLIHQPEKEGQGATLLQIQIFDHDPTIVLIDDMEKIQTQADSLRKMANQLGESTNACAHVLQVFQESSKDAGGAAASAIRRSSVSNKGLDSIFAAPPPGVLTLELCGAFWSLPKYTLTFVRETMLTLPQLHKRALQHAQDPAILSQITYGQSLLNDPVNPFQPGQQYGNRDFWWHLK